jgi:hypothetical protein
MLNMLKSTIVAPIPGPWPYPGGKIDVRDILVIALLYISILILIKGIVVGTACAMASRKYNIGEDVLLQAVREKLWA